MFLVFFTSAGSQRMFTCTPGISVELDKLCNGVNDCDNGDDETTALCES